MFFWNFNWEFKAKDERITFKYLEKLGLLNSIEEEEEKFIEKEENEKIAFSPKIKTPFQSVEGENFSRSKCSNEDSRNSFEIKNYIDNQVELLLKVKITIKTLI